jgi:hypothetical protein
VFLKFKQNNYPNLMDRDALMLLKVQRVATSTIGSTSVHGAGRVRNKRVCHVSTVCTHFGRDWLPVSSCTRPWGEETKLIGCHGFLHISYCTPFKAPKSTLYTGSGDALKSAVSPRPGARELKGRESCTWDRYALLPLTLLILLHPKPSY